MLKKAGIIMPEGHMDGYKYMPQKRVVEKQSWEVKPGPNSTPQSSSSSWNNSDVSFELGQGIAYITLNRPQTNNSLNDGMMQGIHDACFELHRRSDIRIVVLRAEGKMFCAGGDPKSFQDTASMTDAQSQRSSVCMMRLLHYFQSLPQFTIGLAQGSAMGTGVGLLAACDAVCAVNSARFVVSEVKIGMCPAAIVPVITSKVGASHAKRIMCTAENISAPLAKQMGLVTELVDDEAEFSKYVETICDKITLCAPLASARSKRLVQNVASRPLTLKLISYTGGELADVRVGEEAVKGMIAVQAKTRPSWAEIPIKPLY